MVRRPMDERERHLLDLVEGLRVEMNSKLDALVLAIKEDAPKKAPRKRRAPLRPPVAGPVLITDDIVKAKARAALERMGIRKVRE